MNRGKDAVVPLPLCKILLLINSLQCKVISRIWSVVSVKLSVFWRATYWRIPKQLLWYMKGGGRAHCGSAEKVGGDSGLVLLLANGF